MNLVTLLTSESITRSNSVKKTNIAGFRALVNRFEIPGAFIDEKAQAVLNSFGHMEENDKSVCEFN